MTRTVTLWRVWESSDMGLSDSFFPTKKEALEHAKEGYDAPIGKLARDGVAECVGETPEWAVDSTVTFLVYLQPVDVEMTKEGIARALTNLPHR